METLLKDTIDIVKAAGAAIMEYYQSATDNKDQAPDNSNTEAHEAANTLLKEQLLKRLPEAGWLNNETFDDPERLLHKKVWIVDPLDGVQAFVQGIPEFTVSVALANLGHPTIGVIYNPAREEIFYAEKGKGVYFNDQLVQVSEQDDLEKAAVLVSHNELDQGDLEFFTNITNLHPQSSTAYRIARVAAGQADATWSAYKQREWDICAGQLLVQEAGGRCASIEDGALTFNRINTKIKGVIADNGHLHDAINKALKAKEEALSE